MFCFLTVHLSVWPLKIDKLKITLSIYLFLSGTSPADDAGDAMDTGDMKTKKKFHIDTTSLNFPKAGMEVSTYMRDGMITDWDMFEQVLDYSYKKIIQSQSEYHPVLFSEAPWNKKDRREQLCEIMFEKYNVPAFFLVKNAVLSAFANGRSTGRKIFPPD